MYLYLYHVYPSQQPLEGLYAYVGHRPVQLGVEPQPFGFQLTPCQFAPHRHLSHPYLL